MSKMVEYYGTVYEISNKTTCIATDGNGNAFGYIGNPFCRVPHYASGETDVEHGQWLDINGCSSEDYLGIVDVPNWKDSLKQV